MLRRNIICKTLLITLLACSESAQTHEHDEKAKLDFAQLIDKFSKDYAALHIPPLDLSFKANLGALGTEAALAEQEAVFTRHLFELADINPQELGICDKIDFSVMQGEAVSGQRRARLGLRYIKEDVDLSSAARLLDVPLGADWYDYYLDRWNGADLNPDEIFAFGEEQLKRSVARYRAVQKHMGFEGDDDGLAAHLDSQPRLDGGAPSLALFTERQTTVWKNLGKLFPQTYGLSPAKIAQSDRGASFPAPGYYDLGETTFYYNVLDETGYEARQADWLFLHEGSPGHHFQTQAESKARRCPNRLSQFSNPAYREGWAAYVETLGKDLGLYSSPEAELAAIEWDMVRSVRVALDVALNHYGWSDEKALEYWRANVIGQDDIAEREIARMKRWPAQVITYKYGANVFETVRQNYAVSADSPAIKNFHAAALEYGSMPISTFQALYPDLQADLNEPPK